MKAGRNVLAALGVTLALPAVVTAHRLDEYLQAARVSLSRNQIALAIDLTPGVSVADAIVDLIDRNGDGTISPIEAGAYGAVVLGDLALELDGHAVPLTLTRMELPSRDVIGEGLGTIQLRAIGQVQSAVGGRRQLHFRNDHQPAISAYLFNALLPEEAGVSVVAQARDPRQQTVRVEYDVGTHAPARALWLLTATLVLMPLLGRARSWLPPLGRRLRTPV